MFFNSKPSRVIITSLIIIAGLFFYYLARALAEKSVFLSPHIRSGIGVSERYNCLDCHHRIPEKGEDAGKIIETLYPEYESVCLGCHQSYVPLSCRLFYTQEVSFQVLGQILSIELPLISNRRFSCFSCHTTHFPSQDQIPFRHLRPQYYSFRQKAESINPHKTGVFCTLCHDKEPREGEKELFLKFQGDIVTLCQSCHNDQKAVSDNHPVGLAPSPNKGIKIPPEFPIQGGKLTCITCHDLKNKTKSQNLYFLRGGPYQRSVDACLVCHIKEEYQKMNPHEQTTADGVIDEKKCLFCHHISAPVSAPASASASAPASAPDTASVGSSQQAFTFRAPLRFYCIGCHPVSVKKHPVMTQHTGLYIQKIWDGLNPLEKERLAQQENFISMFPFNITGEILCSTCHNPHDSRKGPKLRISPVNDSCRQCHYQIYGVDSNEQSLPDESWWGRKDHHPEVSDPSSFDPDLDLKPDNNFSFGFRASLRYYCIGCHPKHKEGHPYGVTHVGRFINRFIPRQKVSQKNKPGYGHPLQILPLTFCGQVGCFTCHNPHHNGDNERKLRIGDKQLLCSLCHNRRMDVK